MQTTEQGTGILFTGRHEGQDSCLFCIVTAQPFFPHHVTSGPYRFPSVTRLCLRSFISSALKEFFFTFLYQSNLGWVSQTNEPSRESTALTVYKRNGRVKQQLHTKSLSCLSAHHFSDSDNSTKIHAASLQGKRMRSELTSHIKNTRDQLDLHSNKRCVARIRPKVCSRAMCKPSLVSEHDLAPQSILLPAFHTAGSQTVKSEI